VRRIVDNLPKVDRGALRRKVRVAFEEMIEKVADAVDGAAEGRWIEDSEHPVRDALGEFRRHVYEQAMQSKVDAAEAAFPPSVEHRDRNEETKQGAALLPSADGQRTD
jgi:hypothetical protein